MSKSILKNFYFKTGMSLMLIFILILVFASHIAPYDPLEVSPKDKLLPMSRKHLFGTDNLGRDVFSRMVYGTRITLFSALLISFINLIISIPLGIFAGYFGGIVDSIISRIIDIILAFPSIIISLYILAKLGPGLDNLIFSLSIVGWVRYARVIRTLVIGLKEKTYIKSALISGASHSQIIRSHIIYNSISPIIVLSTLDIGSTILSISALSFLGLGINPPQPEWGIILSEAKPFIESHPHLLIIPSVCIFLVVASFNLVGHAIENNIRE